MPSAPVPGWRAAWSAGTRGGETHWWNLLQLEETWYAVDLMRSVEQGGDSLDLLDPAALRNEGYDWDAEAYPSIPCRAGGADGP